MKPSSWEQPIASLVLAVKHAALDDHNRELVRRIELETSTSAIATGRLAKGATAGGDERRLRGIPAIGRGVQGAINGTRP